MLKPGGRVALTLWGARRGAGQELFGRAFAAAGAVIPADLPRLDPAEDFARTADGFAELLREAGFTDAGADELEWDHRTTLDEWWDGPAAGVATAGIVITSQDAGTVVRIRREYERLAGEFAAGRRVGPAAHRLGGVRQGLTTTGLPVSQLPETVTFWSLFSSFTSVLTFALSQTRLPPWSRRSACSSRCRRRR